MDAAGGGPPPFLDFAIALLIGALVGIEREKAHGDARGIGGIRTFLLFAEAGALGGWLTRSQGSPWILVAATLSVAAVVVAGHVSNLRRDPAATGLTTEVAAVTVCLLGAAVTMGHREIAVALGVLTSAALAFKGVIHGTVARIEQEELFAALKLLIASFIVLPLLPDRTIDPWDAVNPYEAWWLVILISGTSLVGYVAVRFLGARKGLVLTGISGGLVSSTAVTLSLARRSRDMPEEAQEDGPLAAGVLAAWAVMFVRIVVLASVVHAPLVGRLWLPMAAMAVAAAVAAFVLLRRAGGGGSSAEVALKNPFSLTEAVKFALLLTAVMVVVRITEENAPTQGVYAVAALAGLTDVDAITLSMAQSVQRGSVLQTAVVAISIAAVTNTVVKLGIAYVLGTPGLRRRVLAGTIAVLAAGVAAVIAV